MYIPTDFIVMDIKEDFNILILLGKPFLATVGAIIDVKIRKLTLEVIEQKIELILSYFMKAPIMDDTCCFVHVIDEFLKELLLEAPPSEELVVPPTPEVKDLEAELQLDAGLEEFLALT